MGFCKTISIKRVVAAAQNSEAFAFEIQYFKIIAGANCHVWAGRKSTAAKLCARSDNNYLGLQRSALFDVNQITVLHGYDRFHTGRSEQGNGMIKHLRMNLRGNLYAWHAHGTGNPAVFIGAETL